jgi:hypothetical protein
MVNETAVAQHRTPGDPSAAQKVDAIFRVETRKLIASAIPKKQIEAEAKRQSVPADALIELSAGQLRDLFSSAFAIEDRDAAALLANGPDDKKNQELVRVATETLANFDAELPAIMMAVLDRNPKATGWELEIQRRLLEAMASKIKKEAEKNAGK